MTGGTETGIEPGAKPHALRPAAPSPGLHARGATAGANPTVCARLERQARRELGVGALSLPGDVLEESAFTT